VLTTSRTFLLNATYVRDEWIRDDIADGTLQLSMSDLSAFMLEPLPICYAGNQCLRSLLTNKAAVKKDLELQVTTVMCHEKSQLLVIDFSALTL